MWLYTTFGFFSVVKKDGDADLTIRSRVRGDLEKLKRFYLPDLGNIVEHAGTDYQFRAKASHAAFADAMYHAALDIDYSNFKDAVAEKQGTGRAESYGAVWNATSKLAAEPGHAAPPESEDADKTHNRHPQVSQRLLMRALLQMHDYEAMREWRCMPFYAVAEKLGLVERESNVRKISEKQYARALAKDGIKKKWIREELSQEEWHQVTSAFVYRFLLDPATFEHGEGWTL